MRISSPSKAFHTFFRSHPPTPSVWYSHLASGSVRLSSYPSAQVLWRLDFPIRRRVSLRVGFGMSRDLKFLLARRQPPPEPSALHAIHIHPNSLLTILILILSFSLFQSKGKVLIYLISKVFTRFSILAHDQTCCHRHYVHHLVRIFF